MKKDYILVIDSGIGGLSVLAQMLKLFYANFIYFADNKNCPYGARKRHEIVTFLTQIIDNLKQNYSIKIVVLACNTATTSAIEKLRNRYKDMIFVGTEPALRLANKSNFGRILAITTPTTACQTKYKNLQKQLDSSIKTIAMPHFASNIEQNLTNPTILNALRLKNDLFFIKNHAKNYDCIVLGCTHYAIIKDKIAQFTDIPLIDGSLGVACQTRKFQPCMHKQPTKKSKIIFMQSMQNSASIQIYKKILSQILANLWKLC